MRRIAAVTALAATGLLTVPAHAATTTVSFSDPAGDANAVNGQGFTATPSQSTAPAQLASADILKVTVSTLTKKKAAYGIAVTLTLAAAPDSATDYLVGANAQGGCGAGGTLDLQYSAHGAFPVSIADCSQGTTSTPIGLGPATVDAAKHTITWTLDGSGFPKRSKVDGWTAESTVFVAGDFDLASSDATYTYQ